MPENGLDRERLVWMFTQMLRIREFEERVKRTFEEHPGVIRGHTHLADGAEASIVGSLATLRPGRPAADDLPLPRLPDRARHRSEGDDGRDLRPRGRALRGYGGSMHLTDVARGFLGTSGIVGQGIPHATGAAYAAQIRGKGQVVLSLLRRRRLEAGRVPRVAEHRVALEAARRLRDGEQQLQRRHAHRAGGRERRRRRAARREGEGVLDAGRDRRRRRPGRRLRDGRRRRSSAPASGEGPTLVESLVYRLSAHGNIIAPPGCRSTSRSTRRSPSSATPEEYEAALRGDPVPRFRAKLVTDGTLTAEEADAIAESVRAGDAGGGRRSGSRARSRPPEAAVKYVYA